MAWHQAGAPQIRVSGMNTRPPRNLLGLRSQSPKLTRTKVTTPRAPSPPPPAPLRLGRRGVTLRSLRPLHVPFSDSRRFLHPGAPEPPGTEASRDQGPGRPATPVLPPRLHPRPPYGVLPTRATPATLPFPTANCHTIAAAQPRPRPPRRPPEKTWWYWPR